MGMRLTGIFILLIARAGACPVVAQTEPVPASAASKPATASVPISTLGSTPSSTPASVSVPVAASTPRSAQQANLSSVPAVVGPAPPRKPKEFVEPPPPAPTNCPAIAAAVFGAYGEIRDADFFPDEKRIVYISTKSGTPQLYLQELNPVAGKLPPVKPLPKTALDLRGVRVYPDGRALLLSARMPGGSLAFYKLALEGNDGKLIPLSAGKDESQTFMAWGKGGEIWFNATDHAGRAQLRTIGPDGITITEFIATASGDDVGAISPDFNWAAVLLHDGTGKPVNVTLRNLANKLTRVMIPPGRLSQISQLEFTRDSRTLRLLGVADGKKQALYELSLELRPFKLLAQRDEDIVQAGSLDSVEWVVELNGGRPQLSLSQGGAEIPQKLAPPASGAFLPLRTSISGKKLLLRAEGEGQPGDLWLYAGVDREPLRLTDLRNPAISSDCDAGAKPIMPDPADPALTGWLYEPKKIQAGVILLPDAPGPGFRPQFDGRINYFVSRGFLVLALNRRGTDCCGVSWAFADGFASDASLQEVAAARKYLLAAGVPENRVVLWGEGTGGTLALRAMQNAARDYAAGVIISAPVDLAAWRAELSSRVLRRKLVFALGENGAARRRSPLNGSFEKSPPLILLHGGDDEIVSVSQTEALAEELIASGRIVAFHVFEGAGHELDRPADRASALSSVGKFLRRHVLMKAAPKKP